MTDLDPTESQPSERPSGLDVRNASLEALESFVVENGEPPYRAKQIYRWVHQRGARSFDEMTDLPKALRIKLAEQASLPSMHIKEVERATDGTRKYAFESARGDVVEAVFIPDASAAGRNTLCISSQVGCAVDCQFCLTASLGLLRNLGPGEIVEQVTRVKEDLEGGPLTGKKTPRDDDGDVPRIGNIVMMGMGEPLQNYKALIPALKTMSDELGHHISPRRITVSTAGLVPRIPRLGHDVPVQLAVSLNATTDEVRDEIMPINKRWNIKQLLDACRAFPLSERRRITFEYVLLAGVNDANEDARRLVKLLRGIRSKVNLIPFNEHPYSPYKRPAPARVASFQAILRDAGMTVLVRTPRGDDISAACGQLGAQVDAPRIHSTERQSRLKVLTR
ncbi:MAG: 23S rRNA (adenine(2503)-C(2))-methyltransferase RlmN [Myxococcota bacterium]